MFAWDSYRGGCCAGIDRDASKKGDHELPHRYNRRYILYNTSITICPFYKLSDVLAKSLIHLFNLNAQGIIRVIVCPAGLRVLNIAYIDFWKWLQDGVSIEYIVLTMRTRQNTVPAGYSIRGSAGDLQQELTPGRHGQQSRPVSHREP